MNHTQFKQRLNVVAEDLRELLKELLKDQIEPSATRWGSGVFFFNQGGICFGHAESQSAGTIIRPWSELTWDELTAISRQYS